MTRCITARFPSLAGVYSNSAISPLFAADGTTFSKLEKPLISSEQDTKSGLVWIGNLQAQSNECKSKNATFDGGCCEVIDGTVISLDNRRASSWLC